MVLIKTDDESFRCTELLANPHFGKSIVLRNAIGTMYFQYAESLKVANTHRRYSMILRNAISAFSMQYLNWWSAIKCTGTFLQLRT